MKDHIIIEKYQSEDYEKYRMLFQEVFNKELEEKTFRWKYLENPFSSSPLIYLAKDEEGNLLGARSLFPTELWIKGTVVLAAQAGDTMVLKEYRGRGLFSRLTKFGIEDVTAQGFKVIFNFPNENSYPGYIKLGWTALDGVSNYYRILDPAQVLKRKLKSPLLYKPIGGIVRRFVNLWEGIAKFSKEQGVVTVTKRHHIEKELIDFIAKHLRTPVHQTKSKKYLQWRYEMNPNGEYEFLEFRKEEDLVGFVITKILRKDDNKTVEVLEWFVKDEEQKILEKLLDFYKKEKMALLKIWQLEKQAGIKTLLKKHGFIEKSTTLHFVAMPLGNPRETAGDFEAEVSLREVTKINNWYVHKGDTDTA